MLVAPLAGAWIEIEKKYITGIVDQVAPLAGAWIEIRTIELNLDNYDGSLPSRERGLKLHERNSALFHARRSPRGSVD